MQSNHLAPRLNGPATAGGKPTRTYARRIGWRVRMARSVVAALVVGAWLVVAPAVSRPVAAAGDPVIAAAGDIACDPLDSQYNNGVGTPNYSRQSDTANLLVNGNFAAIL